MANAGRYNDPDGTRDAGDGPSDLGRILLLHRRMTIEPMDAVSATEEPETAGEDHAGEHDATLPQAAYRGEAAGSDPLRDPAKSSRPRRG